MSGFGAWLRSLRTDRSTLARDTVAGLPGAIGSVPDGMASSLLAGVSPVYGLYASMAGPIAGGLFASTARMIITTTSAASLAAGSALASVSASDRPRALFLLTALAGVLMILAGLARLGRFTRFVSYSVMAGFLTGIAVNIIFGQLPDATGVKAHGSLAIQKALNVLIHPGSISLPALGITLSALVLMAVLSRTPARSVSALVALAIPSLIVYLAHLRVATVSASGPIPRGLPVPGLPSLAMLSSGIITGAFAVAVIVLVQGAGVSETAPNLDGSRSSASRDFLAQGAGNVAAGLFKGQPVGGSVGQTALSVSAGARSRWAAIFSGLWMALILVLFSGIVGHVATATLAALLMFAAAASIRTSKIALTLRTGRISQIAVIATFAATLLLPISTAVGVGVGISLILQLNQEALDLKVIRLVPDADGHLRVVPVPASLPGGTVTMLDVYGTLMFAGARTLGRRLPDPAGGTRAAVVLRLRGHTTLTATATDVLTDYARRLDQAGGRLYLSGLDPDTARKLRGTRRIGPSVVGVEATGRLGESSLEAYHLASSWVAG